MAFAAIAAASALASAGAGIYGAVQSGNSQRESNRLNRENMEANRAANAQNSLMDAINGYTNLNQRDIDNRRYDEAVEREERQRALTNALATATQRDADGNAVVFDPLTRSWIPVSQGIGRTNQQRRQQGQSADYTQALLGNTLGNMRAQDRQRDAGSAQSAQRALAQELLTRYGTSQGRTPEQLQAAGIERGVAAATDPLRTGGNMAMLAGYRQGNSGSDALLGALARQSQGGTRSAIAEARYAAPLDAYSERDAAAKAVLSPATTLMERGSSAPGERAPTFAGDTSGALISAIQRGNAAGVGSQLNPRSGSPLATGRAATNLAAYTPLNASGNQWAGISESMRGLINDPNVKRTANALSNWWNGGQNFNVAPTAGTRPNDFYTGGNMTSEGIRFGS